MDDDLQRFREAWIAEVNQVQLLSSDNGEGPQSEQSEAVNAYIAASNHERCGNFHAAMTEYRRGIKILLTPS